jgi:MFS family permease
MAPPPKASPKLPSRTRRYVVLGALVLLYVSNQWARMLPSFLVAFDEAGRAGRTGRELMNVALDFNAAQYGLLVSYGFTLLYVACSFPAGVVCDTYSRKRVLLCAAGGWSVATVMAAGSQSYAQLLGARVLLGITQAFSGPAAHTLISATFPPNRRATANAIYTCGIYLGGALASSSVVLSRWFGWRIAAYIAAAAAVPPAAVLAIALREPPSATPSTSSSSSSSPSSSPLQGVQTVLQVKSVRWLMGGAAARLFAGFAIGAWTAPYFRSAFPSETARFSLLNALVVAIGGSFSAVCGGVLADKLTSTRGGKVAPQRAALLPAIGSLVAIPFWIAAVRLQHFYLAMASLLVAYIFAECWFGATISLMQGALPQSVWGTAQGSLNIVQVVGNLSPLLLGALYTRGVPLRMLLSVTVPTAYVLTAVCFWRAMVARAGEAASELEENASQKGGSDAPATA